MTPTKEQIERIKYSSRYISTNISKQGILAVITEWEKIRGK